MKAKLLVSMLVKSAMALGSIAIMSQSINSVNSQLTTALVEHPPNLLSGQTPTRVSLQTSSEKSINQPVRTAGISLGGTFAIFLVFGVVVFAVISPRGVVVIGNDEVGIVIKKYNLNPFSPKLSAGQLIALKGEAGSQAKILTPGIHWGYFPQMYTIRKEKVIKISPEEIGLVVAKDGASMPPGQLFGKVVECNNFQDARAFIENGGQKGKQLAILTPGTYRINTELFDIRREPIIKISPEEIGLVVAKDGASMLTGQIFAKFVECNNFQDAQAFIDNGGQKGKQLGILTPGIYRINTELFDIRNEPSIKISSEEIGLVVAKDGASMPTGQIFAKFVECDNFQDAQAFIDNGGQKGKQLAILTPGSYRINTELFDINKKPVINIPSEKIGLVVAKDGAPMLSGQLLGKVVDCNNFQDARAFIENGGQKGKQLAILNPGIYQVNTELFDIRRESVINIPQGEIGLVVAKDGAPMPPGQLFGKVVECNNFQDGREFIKNGGQMAAS